MKIEDFCKHDLDSSRKGWKVTDHQFSGTSQKGQRNFINISNYWKIIWNVKGQLFSSYTHKKKECMEVFLSDCTMHIFYKLSSFVLCSYFPYVARKYSGIMAMCVCVFYC